MHMGEIYDVSITLSTGAGPVYHKLEHVQYLRDYDLYITFKKPDGTECFFNKHKVVSLFCTPIKEEELHSRITKL